MEQEERSRQPPPHAVAAVAHCSGSSGPTLSPGPKSRSPARPVPTDRTAASRIITRELPATHAARASCRGQERRGGRSAADGGSLCRTVVMGQRERDPVPCGNLPSKSRGLCRVHPPSYFLDRVSAMTPRSPATARGCALSCIILSPSIYAQQLYHLVHRFTQGALRPLRRLLLLLLLLRLLNRMLLLQEAMHHFQCLERVPARYHTRDVDLARSLRDHLDIDLGFCQDSADRRSRGQPCPSDYRTNAARALLT